MKNKFLLSICALVLVVLAACGTNDEKADEKDAVDANEEPQTLDVALEVPETADPNADVKLSATVTQGDEKVKDANIVEFEIWTDGKKEESETVKSTNNNDGTYTAEKKFEHDGIYTVQAHVTARDLHTMPKKTITIGTGTANEQSEATHDEHAEGEGHGTEGFSLHFMKPEVVKTNTKVELMTHLELTEKPLEKAKVRYEIWNDAISDKHEWAEAKEDKAGEYNGIYTFKEAGTYNVTVHVEDDAGLHEHEEHTIEVK